MLTYLFYRYGWPTWGQDQPTIQYDDLLDICEETANFLCQKLKRNDIQIRLAQRFDGRALSMEWQGTRFPWGMWIGHPRKMNKNFSLSLWAGDKLCALVKSKIVKRGPEYTDVDIFLIEAGGAAKREGQIEQADPAYRRELVNPLGGFVIASALEINLRVAKLIGAQAIGVSSPFPQTVAMYHVMGLSPHIYRDTDPHVRDENIKTKLFVKPDTELCWDRVIERKERRLEAA